ncbi:hypothetical protein [Terasakiella brassicae]|nr:hypothetical protein [Terasakiella brassicae]
MQTAKINLKNCPNSKRNKGTPRPNRFRKVCDDMQECFSGRTFKNVSRCLNDGAIYVIDDLVTNVSNPEHVVSSLSALEAFDKLHLPHSHIWIESAEPVTCLNEHGVPEDAYISIAAYETGEGIFFNLYVEFRGIKFVSKCVCKIVLKNGKACLGFEEGQEYYRSLKQADEYLNAAAIVLVNFLFMLNCQDVEIKNISHHRKPLVAANSNRPKKKKRDYTLIRFSRYVSDKTKAGSETVGPYRYVIRCAHLWGKNTRPPEQQRWVDATLVRIAANDNEANTVKKPSYRLSRL